MYRRTENPDVIVNIETNTTIPRGHWMWPTEWLQINEPLPFEPVGPAPHSPEHYRAIRDAAFTWMRGVVAVRGYDSIETCVGYFNSSVERYRLEARAMVAWRDDVNQALERLVLSPPEGVETWDQVRALLPQPTAYAWPATVELPLDAGESAPAVVMS
ncbi:hypothetical protein [Stenotrophomonas sp. 2694]|uniref:hypothetical protein n=1 Tax=Stenotrophomonas sp. 2694 TaxID=3156317 RepID=UPI003395A27B